MYDSRVWFFILNLTYQVFKCYKVTYFIVLIVIVIIVVVEVLRTTIMIMYRQIFRPYFSVFMYILFT